MRETKINIGLVDDHALFREGIARILEKVNGFEVSIQAGSGEEFLDLIESASDEIDIAIVDVNMRPMSGFIVTRELKKHHPDIKVLALSMNNDEMSIIKMLKAGAIGYLFKGDEPFELTQAIKITHAEGFYYGVRVNKVLRAQMEAPKNQDLKLVEIEFLELCCTEYTYKEMAKELGVSPRTIDGYRDKLFEKLDVHSRTGLVVYAIKNELVKI